jgi:very-short-patch-repair endonuclease
LNEGEARALLVATAQYGIVSRADALRCGMTDDQIDHRLATGRWIAAHPAVFRVAGTPVTGRQRAFAACTWLGGYSSHTTAGALLRLDGIRSRELHITREGRRGQGSDAIVVHTTRHLERVDVVTVDGIPCFSATRTILSIAPMVDDETLETAFEHARRMRLTSAALLERRFAVCKGPGFAGTARVRRLLANVDDRPRESRLEVRAARLLRRNSIEPPATQVPVGPYRLDFAWPGLRLALECDGYEWHGNRLAWKRDRRRAAYLEARGWRLVHVTWDDLTKRPSETVTRIRHALAIAA